VSATVSVPDSPRWRGRLFSGRPHQTITTGGTTYLRRWFLCPPNRWLNCYLHHFVASDDPTALHDHPWWFMSICLRNGYKSAELHRMQHCDEVENDLSCWWARVRGFRVTIGELP
jgi:hypothetical protein